MTTWIASRTAHSFAGHVEVCNAQAQRSPEGSVQSHLATLTFWSCEVAHGSNQFHCSVAKVQLLHSLRVGRDCSWLAPSAGALYLIKRWLPLQGCCADVAKCHA